MSRTFGGRQATRKAGMVIRIAIAKGFARAVMSALLAEAERRI